MKRHGIWTDIGLFALLYFLWLLTSTEQFRKFFHDKAIVFCLAGGLCIGLTLAFTTWLARRTTQISWAWLALFWIVIAVAYLTIYPITLRHLFGAGSDSENALLTAATDLLHGHFPYYRRTYLNNRITPMPGSLLLAIPFLLIGRVSYQALFWMACFVLFAGKFFRLRLTALAFLVITIFASAGILNELMVGADYTLNAIYIAVAVWWVVRAHRTGSLWLQTLAAVFLGLALSSRVIYVVIPPLIFAYLMQHDGMRAAIRTVIISIGVAASVTVPFYLYDPAHFAPLHVANKLYFLPLPAQHLARILLPAVALLIACIGFFRRLTLPELYLFAGLATGAMLIPAGLLDPVFSRFSPESWQLLEYASPAAIYLSLWAFYRFEQLHLLPADASHSTPEPA